MAERTYRYHTPRCPHGFATGLVPCTTCETIAGRNTGRKRCRSCHTEKPATARHFYRTPDGYWRAMCNACHNRQRQRRAVEART